VLLDIHARLRGVDDDVPFVPDGRTLRHTQMLTLDSELGPIDLLTAPSGAPPYTTLRARATAVQLSGVRVLIASLDDLEAMKRSAGRAKDTIDLEEIAVIRDRLQP
jgi:predicted nucleotidyltransferase